MHDPGLKDANIHAEVLYGMSHFLHLDRLYKFVFELLVQWLSPKICLPLLLSIGTSKCNTITEAFNQFQFHTHIQLCNLAKPHENLDTCN